MQPICISCETPFIAAERPRVTLNHRTGEQQCTRAPIGAAPARLALCPACAASEDVTIRREPAAAPKTPSPAAVAGFKMPSPAPRRDEDDDESERITDPLVVPAPASAAAVEIDAPPSAPPATVVIAPWVLDDLNRRSLQQGEEEIEEIAELESGLFDAKPDVRLDPPDLVGVSSTAPASSRPRPSLEFSRTVTPLGGDIAPAQLAAAKRSARLAWAVAIAAVVSASLVLLTARTAGQAPSARDGAAEAAAPRERPAPSETTTARAPGAADSRGPGLTASASAALPIIASSMPSATARAAGSANAPPAGASAELPEGPEFDKAAARAVLADAAARASGCKLPEGEVPVDRVKVAVIFAASGRVTSARVTSSSFQGTKAGGCIANAFRGVSVPAFGGSPVTITKDVVLR